MSLLPLGTPALPLDEAGKYVAGAYIVFVLLLVIYVSIMAIKLQRIEKELRELATFAEQGPSGTPERGAAQSSPGPPERGAEQGSPGTPGRGAEDVPVDSKTQPAGGSDRNLVPSEATAGPSTDVRGSSDV